MNCIVLFLFSEPLGQCPTGWLERPGSNECYLLTTRQSKTWHDARRDCQLQQGDLVVIDTIQERVNYSFKSVRVLHLNIIWKTCLSLVIINHKQAAF